jgi:purine-binding chemotaxis protein CheW
MAQTLKTEGHGTVLLATFHVGDTQCALDAVKVQEVIRPGDLTPVHHAPPEVVGVLNLRGRIVTVLDLSLKLGLAKVIPGPHTRVFIVDDHSEFIGLMVDWVGDVVEIEDGLLQPLPANTAPEQARFLRGVCRVADRVMAVLDTGAVLAERAAA